MIAHVGRQYRMIKKVLRSTTPTSNRYLLKIPRTLALTGLVMLAGMTWVSTDAYAYRSVAAGGYHTVALTNSGEVLTWGAGLTDTGEQPEYGQSIVPATAKSGVVAVAAGRYHTVALKSDGTVVAWGNNGYGQTSTGGLSDVIAVAAGAYHTVALTSSGTVVAWGAGTTNTGQETEFGQSIVPAAAQSGVIAIAAGKFHTAALKSDGTVIAWGGNGELQADVPVGLSNVVAIAAGGFHTAALKSDGTVVAWGFGDYGQTSTGSLSGIVDIVAGEFHTVALASDGEVIALGAGTSNTGFDPSYGQSIVPPDAQSGVVAIAAGAYHTLALKSDGTIVAWGNDVYGQAKAAPLPMHFGMKAAAAGSAHTVGLTNYGEVLAWGLSANGQTTVPAAAQSGVIAIAAGANHTVALKDTGQVLAWGLNGNGQIAVPAAAQSGVIAIAAGANHTVALKDTGEVLAWGDNSLGQATVPPAATSGVIDVAAGESHTVALKSDGTVVAWGNGAYGQTATAGLLGVVAIAAGAHHTVVLMSSGMVFALGAGTTITGAFPEFGQSIVPSEALSGVIAIAAGAYHTMALKNTGEVVGWGLNGNGQTSVPSAAQSGVIAIAAGANHTVALKDTGQVLAWGLNDNGQTTVPSGTVTVTLASSSPTSTYGASVTFTAAVVSTGDAHTPRNYVTFKDNGAAIGTAPLNAGTAILSTAALAGGVHTIIAEYSGDAIFSSNSGSVVQTVGKVLTTTLLTSAPSGTTTYGSPVTFTATVTSTTTTLVSGTVTFKDGLLSLGTVSIPVSSNTATLTVNTLAAGSHSITAEYSGDVNCLASISSILPHNIPKTATTVSVASSSPTSTYGSPVTFTATVASTTTGIPGGTMTFKDGSTIIGTVSIPVSGSTATLIVNTLTAGSHSITAEYNGDVNFLGAVSPILLHSITKDATTTLLTSAPSGTSTYGSPVTFTATVTSTTATLVSGSVTFKDGLWSLGTVSIPVSSNTATLTVTTLITGNHDITAEYGGDGNFLGSASTILPHNITKASTTVSVASSSPTSTYGSPVTFTATVASATTGTPGGTMTFKDGLLSLGTVSIPVSGNTATLIVNTLTAGNHSITAEYSGDTNFQASAWSILPHSVTKASTTVSVASSSPTSTYGSPVTFTATVASATTGTPGGTVTFKNGLTSLGTVSVPVSSNTTTLIVNTLTAGNHSITAEYSGDTNFQASASSILPHSIAKASANVSVASSSPISIFGNPVTFTATVTSTTIGIPAGTVTFKDGLTTLGTAGLDAGGVATFTTSALTGGDHSITVEYGGDALFLTSTSTVLSQTVNRAATIVTLPASLPDTVYGTLVTFVATVSSGTPGIVTGTMTFKDGLTTLGTATLSGGVASYSTAALAGTEVHSITAEYSGDTNFGISASSPCTVTVNPATTSASVASDYNPSAVSGTVNFTATVTNVNNANTPAGGTVTFKDGLITLGTVTISGGTATYSTSALLAGLHAITAVYSGNANFMGSTSLALSQRVVNATSATGISTSLNPSAYGDLVTVSAVVTSSSGTPTGSVVFKDGSATLGIVVLTNGSAQVSTPALTGGEHEITAVYQGNDEFAMSTSAPLTQLVSQAPSNVSLVSSAPTTTYGTLAIFTATVWSSTTGTQTGTVTFRDGGVTLGTVALSGGMASFSTTGLGGGEHPSVTAVYSGDTNYLISTSNAVSHTVNKASTATAVASSVLLPVVGDAVTFTAMVANTSSGVTPVGSVTFKDGGTVLGAAALSGGTAQFTTTSLTSGSHAVTAEYNGNTDTAASASSEITQTVRIADGSFTGGAVDMTDALKALRIASGLDAPTASDLDHGDVAPLVNGRPRPDNKVDINDVVAILRKAVGLPSF